MNETAETINPAKLKMQFRKELLMLEIAIIEDCAQVAEWKGYATVGRKIAAAIRAKKKCRLKEIKRL